MEIDCKVIDDKETFSIEYVLFVIHIYQTFRNLSIKKTNMFSEEITDKETSEAK